MKRDVRAIKAEEKRIEHLGYKAGEFKEVLSGASSSGSPLKRAQKIADSAAAIRDDELIVDKYKLTKDDAE